MLADRGTLNESCSFCFPLPYIAIDRVTKNTIEVGRVDHSSQDRP